MKKLLIFSALFVFLIVSAVGVYALINFASLEQTYSPANDSALKDSARSAAELYAAEHYPDYDADYNSQSNVLTLSKTTAFSLASAASVYTDLSSYLTQAKFIALDISYACDAPELTVVLRYLSADSEPMLSVSSDGTLTRHWK